MEYSRRELRDQRRRRVFIDDRLHGSSTSDESGQVGARMTRKKKLLSASQENTLQNYTPEAVAASQLRIADLIPTRPWTLWVLFLLGLCVVFGLDALAQNRITWRETIGAGEMACFALDGRGTLTSWFSSLLLLCAACLSGVIYTLRLHRRDDYRGRYRLWLWMVGGLLFLSANATARLDELLFALGSFGWDLMNRGSLVGAESQAVPAWSHLLSVVVLAPLAVFLAWEIRRSRGAATALAFAATAFLTAGFCTWRSSDPEFGAFRELWVIGDATCVSLGHLLLLLSIAVYSRYVYLDAQGAIRLTAPIRRIRSKQDSSAKTTVKNPPSADSTHDETSKTPQGKQSTTTTAKPARKAPAPPAKRAATPTKPALKSSSSKSPDSTSRKPTGGSPISSTAEGDAAPARSSSTKVQNPAGKDPAKQAKSSRNMSSRSSPEDSGQTKTPPTTETVEEPSPTDSLSRSERRRLRKEKRREKKRQAA